MDTGPINDKLIQQSQGQVDWERPPETTEESFLSTYFCPQTGEIDLDERPEKTILVTVITIMIVIIILGSIGNLFVIGAVLHQKKLRTTSNMFVVNLSACDFLFVTTVLPFNVYTYLTNDWRLEPALCRFIGFLGYTLTGTTIMTITLIAWNRYKLVVNMPSYRSLFSNGKMAVMLACTWIAPAIPLQAAVFQQWGNFGFVPQLSSCNLALDESSQSFKVFLLIIRAAIPSGLIIYFYTAIYATTHASHRRLRDASSSPKDSLHQHNIRHEMRLTRMMVSIFVVFALSYFPCAVSSVIDWRQLLSKKFHLFCQTVVFLGSAINPLLYGFMNEQFRLAYYNIITCRAGKPKPGTKPGRSACTRSMTHNHQTNCNESPLMTPMSKVNFQP